MHIPPGGPPSHRHGCKEPLPALEGEAGAASSGSAAPELPEGQGEGPSTRLPERLATEDVRSSMMRVIIAWGFGAAFMSLSSGAVYTAFARSIGASNTIFGVLAGAMPLMSVLQVLAAWTLERHRRRKRQFLIAGLIGRGVWLLVPLLPLARKYLPALVPGSVVLPGVAALILISAIGQAFVSPAFFSWMTDLAHSRVRSTFFARRMQVGTLAGMLVSIAGGLIADNFAHLEIYCAVLFLAACLGLGDILMFLGVRDPRHLEPRPPEVDAALDELARAVPSPLAAIREPLREAPVRRFLLFVCLLFAGYGLYGPFLWLHSFEYLHLSKTQTGLIVNAAPMLAIAMTSRFWGRLTQRYGNRPVMRLGSMGLMLVPLGMLLMQPDPDLISKILFGALFFASGILAVAVDLANVNMMTNLCPQVPRSTMTALYSIAGGCSFALCSAGAGKLSDALSDWEAQLGPLHFENYHVLFVLSLAVRVLNALAVAPRLQEPGSGSARRMAFEMVPQIWSNFAGRLPRPFARD